MTEASPHIDNHDDAEAPVTPESRVYLLGLALRRAAPIAPGRLFAEFWSLDIPEGTLEVAIDEIFNDQFFVLETAEIPS